jgi:endonuclease/exonuclease/phosphatase family metal-dependent hydrolase
MVLALIAAVVAYLAVALIVTRLSSPPEGPIAVRSGSGLPPAGDTLSVLTWNIGYAGLGAGSDFVADGGTHYLPPSRAAVETNLAAIVADLARMPADVTLIQEVVRPNVMNYWVDVAAALAAHFNGRAEAYDFEVATRLLPPPLRIAHGNASFAAVAVAAAERRPLPLEDEWLLGVLRRHYGMLVVRLPMSGSDRQWVVVNVHLAAFDKDAALRHEQLAAILAFGEREYAQGNAVIVGGDFNLEFVRDRFPHATGPEFRFWLHDFPVESIPAGWTAAFDPDVPTVRTVHRPYVAGENYVTVIDGFIVSPNVAVESVRGIDLGFANSDHQPVLGVFKRR